VVLIPYISVFIIMNYVAHGTSFCMRNRNWFNIENNLLVHRQLCQNAVTNDVVWDLGEFRWRKKKRKVTMLSAVVQCSLVERHHYK